MREYDIEFRPTAAKALAKLERDVQLRLRGVLALLRTDPRPPSSRKLQGRDAYRVRSGDYRLIYTIVDEALVVVVVTVGHRRDVYER
ncbi:type II toxin-antitoxin system RelE family toxin [Subtercola frigoramans]|uniref:mRNA interferase RelE/StbE n=1 Tax=Subtercola frigoramans TaxID=120298 RepID=A0ABS2L6C3_9MICO|nr:type II toxin-antitoxin system RelE/ParE family toxin [Subtercola frigoramans]MBM7472633.1 mRNA interferase RelE/StbE [Subtercola frigoramans]